MIKQVLILTIFFGLLASTSCLARNLRFSWLPNSETNIAGYKLHSGKISGQYDTVIDVKMGNIDDGRVVSDVVSAPDDVQTYWAVTAYNTEKLESNYSTEITVPVATVPNPPAAPTYTIIIPGVQIIPTN